MIKRRLTDNPPLEYQKERTKFLRLPIDLSLRPLIPRKETAFWTRKAIAAIKKRPANQTVRCLDIFSGSGCVGLAVLKKVKNAHVDFGEINKNFIKQIEINLRLNKISPKRYRIIQSDIFQDIESKYDFILANPPYISPDRKYLVQKSVLSFEPHGALFAGQDGMFYIKKFLKEAKKHLNKSGVIYLEIDSLNKTKTENLLTKLDYRHFHFFKDQYRKWRFVVLRLV